MMRVALAALNDEWMYERGCWEEFPGGELSEDEKVESDA